MLEWSINFSFNNCKPEFYLALRKHVLLIIRTSISTSIKDVFAAGAIPPSNLCFFVQQLG